MKEPGVGPKNLMKNNRSDYLQALNPEIGGQNLDDVEGLSRQVQLDEDLVGGPHVPQTVR